MQDLSLAADATCDVSPVTPVPPATRTKARPKATKAKASAGKLTLAPEPTEVRAPQNTGTLAPQPTEALAAETGTEVLTLDEPGTSPFEGVPAPLRTALVARGFTSLTLVQRAVLDAAAEGRDLQISSQTGSGKTVALGFVLAPGLIEAAAQGRRPSTGRCTPRALVIAPTRELAVQVHSELEWLFASVGGVRIETATGGCSVGQERRRLSANPMLVVGTPGRLLDHLRSGAIDGSAISQLVLDEADRMLDMGFREDLEAILDATETGRRTHLVSATFPAGIRRLAKKYQTDPLAVQGTVLGAANDDIEHVAHVVRGHDRDAALVNILLLAEGERTLVFVDTRARASELADRLASEGFAAAPISGDLEQSQRTRTLDAFRRGEIRVLVATDVAARGLDIAEVSTVVHTDAPFDAESYTHRAGRTGRAGSKGRSVLLVAPSRARRIEGLLGQARVEVQWRDVPTAAMVEKALAKRERRRLREALDAAPEPTASQLANATALLEETDAATLVARLVELCKPPRRATPRDVEASAKPSAAAPRGTAPRAPWRDRPVPGGRPRFEGHHDRHARHEDSRGERRGGAGFGARDEGAGGAAIFEINWGHRGGASPQRVLAVLCRRGEVSNRVIGAIDIDTNTTSFEVAAHAARDFEANMRREDERDPGLLIRRATGGAGRPTRGRRES